MSVTVCQGSQAARWAGLTTRCTSGVGKHGKVGGSRDRKGAGESGLTETEQREQNVHRLAKAACLPQEAG